MGWKEKFLVVLEPVHGTFSVRAYKKLCRKMSGLKTTLRKRSQDCGVKFDISLDEIKTLFLEAYGTECPYCGRELTFRSIACDHIIPLKKQGPSIKANLQLICKSCNTRKGPLDEKDFKKVMNWVNKQTLEVREYLTRKLAKGGRY